MRERVFPECKMAASTVYKHRVLDTDLYNTLDAQSMQSRVLHGRLSRHLYLG